MGNVGISASGLREVFPFFFALDRELRLVDFGRSLGKICTGAQLGAVLTSLFTVARPRLKVGFEALLRARANTFFLESLSHPVRLRAASA